MGRYPADRVTAEASWLGYHDDMFPEDSDDSESWKFLSMLKRGGRTENWKRGVIGGELVPGQSAKWLGEGWAQTKRMTDALHMSWVGPYCPANEAKLTSEQKVNAEALVRRMGYQFRLTELRREGKQLTVSGINEGVAPFYYPWPIEVAILDASGRVLKTRSLPIDIRTWLPGRFTLTVDLKGLPEGRVALGIREPGSQQPTVQFANALTMANGWIILPT